VNLRSSNQHVRPLPDMLIPRRNRTPYYAVFRHYTSEHNNENEHMTTYLLERVSKLKADALCVLQQLRDDVDQTTSHEDAGGEHDGNSNDDGVGVENEERRRQERMLEQYPPLPSTQDLAKTWLDTAWERATASRITMGMSRRSG